MKVLRCATLAAVVAAVAGFVSPTAGAASGAKFGIHDDAWLLSGPGSLAERTAELDRIGVDIVRFTLRWDQIAAREPLDGTDHRDRAYRWRNPDRVLTALNRRGIAVVVTLVGTPSWANGGFDASWAPSSPTAFADFATAAASRYPFVRYWTIWNEPNQARWLKPTTPKIYVNRLLNPAYAAIKQVLPGARVGGGVTAPRGNAGGLSPLAWIAGMGQAHAKLDAYAHHPYPVQPQTETPWSGGCTHCQTISMASLERLTAAVRKSLGPKRIWLTEYGYQTNPPDTWLGIEPALQAIYTAEAALRVWKAPYVDMLINFLYQDDTADSNGLSSGWQSGFVTARGATKPSLRAFMLPLVRAARHGEQTTLWGQVRPRNGVQPYRLQEMRFGSWQWLGGNRVTLPNGSFRVTVKAGRDTRLRIWSPRDDMFGVTLRVK
jgi:Cellulase (glycosyl hydrolase family 5)